MNFFLKTSYTQDDLEFLIRDKVEESIYLDFKASGSIQSTNDKKNEIAKDVSAFANSDGGIIIYGIAETDHVANSFSFIDGNNFTKEWLEQVIQSKISRRIPGIEIHPVRVDNDFSKTVYIVKIPRSAEAPHMTSDKRFYKRYNFLSVQMEEYEVRSLYNKRDNTELVIENIIISDAGSSVQGTTILNMVKYKIDFQVANVSNSIENRYKLEIAIPKEIVQITNPIAEHLIRREDIYSIYSVPNKSCIFQGEMTTVSTIYIELNRYKYQSLCMNPIKVKLYFSSGIKKREFELQNQLKFREKSLKDWWQS